MVDRAHASSNRYVNQCKIFMRRRTVLCSLVFLSIISSKLASAGTNWQEAPIQISIGKLPGRSSTFSDPIPQLMTRISEISREPIELSINPFKRSVEYTAQGKVDMHFPSIYSPTMDTLNLPYTFSSDAPFAVNFVIYTHKCLESNVDRIEDLEVYTDFGLVDLFDFDIKPSTNITGAIKMVDTGRIDALILADKVVDPIIKAEGLTNVRRSLYKTYEARAILAKSSRSAEVDKVFSRAIQRLKASGELHERFGNLLPGPFDNWQPGDGKPNTCPPSSELQRPKN